MATKVTIAKEEFATKKQMFGMWIARVKLNEQEDSIIALEQSFDHEPTDEDYINMTNQWITLNKSLLLHEVTEYDKSSHVNGFYLNGTQAWLDKATRVGLANSIAIEKAAHLTQTVLYLNGHALIIDIEKAQQMLSLLELYALDCYRQTETHKININAITNINELNYDYTTGYPEQLQFEI